MAANSARSPAGKSPRGRSRKASADRVQDFETFRFARFLGLRFEYLPLDAPDERKEACRLTFEVADSIRNPQGALHGGAMASAMDISMGHLLNKVDGPGATIEMKIQFIRPVAAGTAICEGRFIRRGKTLSFMESRLFGPDGKLAALATATWKMP